MINGPLQPTYDKVQRVIRSCKTISQLRVAHTYAQLFVKQVPHKYTEVITTRLSQLLRHQKHILWL